MLLRAWWHSLLKGIGHCRGMYSVEYSEPMEMWGPNLELVFSGLKAELTRPCSLWSPSRNWDSADASLFGLGAVLISDSVSCAYASPSMLEQKDAILKNRERGSCHYMGGRELISTSSANTLRLSQTISRWFPSYIPTSYPSHSLLSAMNHKIWLHNSSCSREATLHSRCPISSLC